MNNIQTDDVDLTDPKTIIANITTVLCTAFRRLVDADDANRQERMEKMDEADQLAMTIAHGLRAQHSVHAETIQSLRMAITVAGIGYSPSAITVSRGALRSNMPIKTYIARNPETGLLKIGKSKDPEARMYALMTGAAAKPELLLVIDTDVELSLHKKFSDLSVFGEWFRDDGSIGEFIKEQKASRREG